MFGFSINKQARIEYVEVVINKKISDHNMIFTEMNNIHLDNSENPNDNDEIDPTSIKTLDFNCDSDETWYKIKNILTKVDWNVILDNETTDSAYNIFQSKLNSALFTHLPKKKGHKEPWEEMDETDESDPSETTNKKPRIKCNFQELSKFS